MDNHYNFGSFIPVDEFEELIKQLKINSDEITNIKKKLDMMYIKIGPTYNELLDELLTLMDMNNTIDKKTLNEWYADKKTNPISQNLFESYLLSKGYSLVGQKNQGKSEKNTNAANKLLNYLIEYYDEQREISNEKLQLLFDQYKIEESDQKWISMELEALDFTIKNSEFDKVLNKLLPLIEHNKTIESSKLRNWFEGELLSLHIQERVLNYLEVNGYRISSFSKNKNLSTIINDIVERYGDIKIIQRKELINLFNKYDIDKEEQKMIVEDLKTLNFSITIPKYVKKLKKLLRMIPEDKKIDLLKLKQWYIDEGINEKDQKRIEKYLISKSFVIEQGLNENVKTLLKHVEERYVSGDIISKDQYALLLNKFQINTEEISTIEEKLEKRNISVGLPYYEEEIKNLLAYQGNNKQIEQLKLIQWFQKENISLDAQEYIKKYLYKNGFTIADHYVEKSIEKDDNLEVFIDFIYDNFKFGSQILMDHLDDLFNKFHIAEDNKSSIYRELESLNITVISKKHLPFNQKVSQLLQLLGSNKSIDSWNLKKWCEEEKISEQEKSDLLAYLQSNEYEINNTENRFDESVNRLTNYIENHLRFGSSISKRQLNSLFSEFQVINSDQKHIYKILRSLQITITNAQGPFQQEIEQLVSYIGESQEIRETSLNKWYEDFEVNQKGQLAIREYLNSNGYSVINDRKQLMDGSGLKFLEGKDSKNLSEILESKEFKEMMDSFEEVIDKRYNIDYLVSYAEGDFEIKSVAMEKIVIANSHLVKKIVGKYKNFVTSSYNEEDMMQAGMHGLMKAAERFDVSRGNQFSTYAVYWIRQSISREIGNLSTTIRVPIHMREQISKYTKVINNFWNSYGYIPNVTELAKLMDIKESKVEEIQKYSIMAQLTSLDVPVGEERASSLGEFIVDQSMITPEEHAENVILKEEINEIFSDHLTDRESEILNLRFGLDGKEKHTLEQTGIKYGVTRERIRQIESKALRKLSNGTIGERLKVFRNDFG